MDTCKEELEAFWRSVEDVQDVKPEDYDSRTQDINNAYETLRKALGDVVPSEIRMAADRALQLLNSKEETTAKSLAGVSGRLSNRTCGSTGTMKAQIQAEKAALEVERQAKLEEMEQVMKMRQREEEERSRRARHDFEMEMMKQEMDKRRLRAEIMKRDAELRILDSETKENHQDHNSTAHRHVNDDDDDDENKDMKAFARTLAESIAVSRLPAPEPPVFTGDPLEYPSWKASFTTLVERRNVPTLERIHFLRRYLGGPAKEAVGGLFFLDSDKAYSKAKAILQQRFGDPFQVTEAFRDKLDAWPKVKDSKDLRNFADFLTQCNIAKECVPGLEILNDCRENRKLLQKLPEWLVVRWGRIAAESNSYPDFNSFTEFMEKEAQIACNPITSLDQLREKRNSADKVTEKKGWADKFTDKTYRRNVPDKRRAHVHVNEVKPDCFHCGHKGHSIHTCRSFERKSPKERREFIISKGICFRCLETGHISKRCPKRCAECKTCGGKHQTILCGDYEKLFPKEESRTNTEQKSQIPDAAATVSHTISGKTNVFRTTMIVPVYLSTDHKQVLTYAMLDTQSDATFINRDIGDALGAPCTDVSLCLTTMSGSSTREAQRFTDLKIRSPMSNITIDMPAAYAIDDIPITKDHIPSAETAQRWDHLSHLTTEMMPLQDADVGVLIGVNCPQALAPLHVIRGKDSEPYAIQTVLGWSIVGGRSEHDEVISHKVISKEVPVGVQTSGGPSQVNFVFRNTVKEILPSDVIKALEGDTFTDDGKLFSQDDLKFMRLMEDQIHLNEEGYYEMPLPFKQRPDLPNNLTSVRQRLVGLKKRLMKNSDFHEEYKIFMKKILDNGEAEEVPPDELDKENVWYIPHHGVFHPQKQKLRVVFDASARFQDTALNDHLMQGPDQLNNLAGLLCRFRKGPVAFTCDVERMFHQFYVNPTDRDFLRFLWWKEGDLDQEATVFRMKVHLFGATSSPACAIFGMRRIAFDHKEEFSQAATEFIADDFYMDDGLKSVELVKEATQTVHEAIELCKKGKLRLHKFISNSAEVMNSIPESERAKTTNKDLTPEITLERTLGLQWCLDTDQFQYNMAPKTCSVTRRAVLSTVASLYDPLGFLAPFVLVGKLTLQQMCKNNVGWDDPVPEDLSDQWLKWKTDLEKLDMVRIDRCYKPKDFGEVVLTEVHHFSDASSQGYGCCSYLRLVNVNGDVHCSLIIGKSRVAPKKTLTIPRMELCAALLSVKSAEFLRSQLKMIYEEYFWTDSMIVLGYIQNKTKRFHVFVANRIQQILDLTKEEQWHYVRSENNPADHASRGLDIETLVKSNWSTGPDFLKTFPLKLEDVTMEIEDDDPEVKKPKPVFGTKVEQLDPILERIKKHSDWDRAIRGLARLRRAVKFKMGKISTLRGCLRVEEIVEMEEEVLKKVQRDAFPEGTRSKNLERLDPFEDKGLIRVGGRLSRSALGHTAKHPIIVPKGHVSELLVRHHHQKVGHQGRGMTSSRLRDSGLWIMGMSRQVSSLIHKCVVCRKLRGVRQNQKMADLPKTRTEDTAPFTYVGMDCFGPFLVKEGRKECKKYGLLFTCMASRAVHIEILDDMTTDAFLNGLRCLIAIRGPVRTLFSDRGTNFVGACNELKSAFREIDDERIKSFLLENRCDFEMNTPSSSHMGGTWERQIRTVRSTLQALLQGHGCRLDSATLRTFMYEAMAIVNSRPLGLETLNDPCSLSPITPNHLLTMKSQIVVPPPGNFDIQDVYARKRWRKVQFLANEFWRRWRNEYLQHLQLRQKWNKEKRQIQVGDIVLLKDDDLVRNLWRIARVTDTRPGEDGHVRKVSLRMADSSELERPIHKLVVLIEKDRHT